MRSTLRAALIAALLLPAAARAEEPGALAGIRQMRIVTGIDTPGDSRQACGITEEVQQQIFARFRDVLLEAGVSVPAEARGQDLSPSQRAQIGLRVPSGAPLAIVSATIVVVQPAQGNLVCAAALMGRLDRTVLGGRLAPDAAPADRRLIAWTTEGVEAAPPGEIAARLVAASGQVGRLLAAAWRADNP